MKKLIFTTALFCAAAITAFAQVGIGTPTPNTSSVLDLNSTTKAFLPPRMTTAQRDLIASPIAGMTIFNTSTDCIEIYRSAGWFNLCSGGGGGNPGVPTSDSVAKNNLVVHWTFDNTKAEAKSGITPTTNGSTSYTAGLIGGATGALAFSGANLVYPTIDTLNKPTTFAGGFTLTMWAKLPVQALYSSLFQINGNIGDIFGLIGLAHRKNLPDNIFDFDGAMTNVDGGGAHSTTFTAHLEGVASGFVVPDNQWTFIVMSYDSTAKTLKYYGNGVLKGSKSIGNIIQPGKQFEMITTNSNPPVSINQVSFGSLDVTPTFPGGVAPAVWQSPNLIAGTVIDDTRLFNKTLTQAEITNLYNYGLAGK